MSRKIELSYDLLYKEFIINDKNGKTMLLGELKKIEKNFLITYIKVQVFFFLGNMIK